jgi:hypothetical protein
MILHCNFEELRALESAGELILASAPVAHPEDVAGVERLIPRLGGAVSIETLDDQRRMRDTIDYICRDLQDRMDSKILEFHPAHEEAVALYFDYGHSRTVLHRLDAMGTEMEAILDLIDGGGGGAKHVTFPD